MCGRQYRSLAILAFDSNAANSGRLFIGEGEKHVAGFSSVHMHAQKDIAATGDGKLELANAGDLRLQSTRLGTSTGADQSISNTGGRVVSICRIQKPTVAHRWQRPASAAASRSAPRRSARRFYFGACRGVTLQANGANPTMTLPCSRGRVSTRPA